MANIAKAAYGLITSSRLAAPEFPPTLQFARQTIIVTGATSGLGLEAAIHYVNLGASTVYITARNSAKGAEAIEAIETRTGTKGKVQSLILDMDTFAGVLKFVKDVKANIKSIDVVLLNAGVHTFDFQLSPDGWEKSLQVNTLSTLLLGLAFMPWMRSVKQPGQIQHLSFTGSFSHTSVDILAEEFPKENVLEYFNNEKNKQSGVKIYAISKLLLYYGVLELAKLAIDKDGRYD
jgi:NAD(P)-dependent dehydrogenase (short-subunit alcohol dehydrogenase family)